MTFGAQGYALGRGEGEGLWFFNGLFTVKAGGPDTREAFTLIEAELPAGEGPPPHIHHNEDEGFYILEGEVSITCGEQTWTAVPGSFAMLPRGVPHSFTVSPAGNARMLHRRLRGHDVRLAASPATWSSAAAPRPRGGACTQRRDTRALSRGEYHSPAVLRAGWLHSRSGTAPGEGRGVADQLQDAKRTVIGRRRILALP